MSIRDHMTLVENSMRDYIERKRMERNLEIVEAGGIQVGDFVNPSDCFGDIWFEVIRVNQYDAENMVRFNGTTVIRYNKTGKSRSTDTEYFGDIRKVMKAEDAKASGYTGGVFHTVEGKIDYGRAFPWPAVHSRTPSRGNGSDRSQEWHPDHPYTGR